ncbi:MAG: alpha/beta hydrolase domain-containing protein, partial [Actinomycetota bacterium]|nr:alpha/beta hydrolase domain-containing protein [Actinomycetota bacterium]
PVYDGVHAHIAGGRRGEFNHRAGQPSVQPTPSFGHRFPFADDPQYDPRTGLTAGLLDRQRELGAMPRVLYTDTASEYWRGDASLAHTSAADGSDVEPPSMVRRYLFSSTQHGAGALPLLSKSIFGSQGGNYFNTVDYTPLIRAAVTNLLAWITDDIAPPPNAVPRSSDGTAVSRDTVLESLAVIGPVAAPSPAGLWTIRPLDLGPGQVEGIGAYPATPTGDAYPCLVSAVDADGNEMAGIRLPEVAVPVATNAGWNPRHPDTGAVGEILEYVGSTVPFAATEADRAETGDPRPSIAARYANEDDYRRLVREHAEQLVADRYLLAEDVETCERIAVRRYRAFVGLGHDDEA